MLQVSQVEIIRDELLRGKSIAEIARAMGIDYNTVKKYANQEDFNETGTPVMIRRTSVLDPYKDEIKAMYTESLGWGNKKQRYTAKRVWILLGQKHVDFSCSYPVVARFMKAYKQEQRMLSKMGFDELVWHPGEAQVDFGEADFLVDAKMETLKFLVVTFPASNKAFVQLFRGENAECVCQGLRNVFEHLGGVFILAIFDNATGVGRRIGEIIRFTKLFSKFRMHYGFLVRFCNPDSGNEKGNVEVNVGYVRRNLFVPPLVVTGDIEDFNKTRMFQLSNGLRVGEKHYKHGALVDDLFELDRNALKPLPMKPFEVFTRLSAKTDGYGRICLDKSHFYTLGAGYANSPVLVDVSAWEATAYDPQGKRICTFRRTYGNERTASVNIEALLLSLSRKPGSWPNSGIREMMDDCPFKQYLDDPDTTRKAVAAALQMLQQLSQTYPFDVARMALDECLRKGRELRSENAVTVANRILTFDIGKADNVTGVDLGKYDVLLPKPVEVRHA